ncbi:MAG TPA: DUF397 domain-containing protein [Actinomadura sp.]|jgi:hypothetical protein|nr:DUF397 domain-containing protein [Actinomadura sp.]
MDGRHDLSRAVWRKSSRSNGGEDACVEIAAVNPGHAVRDSKDPHGGVLMFGGAAWRAFLDQVREGSFDL